LHHHNVTAVTGVMEATSHWQYWLCTVYCTALLLPLSAHFNRTRSTLQFILKFTKSIKLMYYCKRI